MAKKNGAPPDDDGGNDSTPSLPSTSLTVWEEKPNPAISRHRVNAHRVKVQIETDSSVLSAEQLAWYEEYKRVAGVGMSATERIVHSEERSMTQGPQGVSLADALLAREEGRRVDLLIDRAILALEKSNQAYERLADHCLKRLEVHDGKAIEMMEVVRDHFLARVQAEGAAMARETEDDAEDSELEAMFMETFKEALLARKKGKPPKKPPAEDTETSE